MAKTRRKPWFRMWDEALTDPKMMSLTNAQFGMWCKLLCFANQQTVRGIISFEPGTFDRTFELVCHSRRQISTNALKKFQELGMIEIDLEEGYVTITNWNKRQFASDDVTARTRKFKESKRSRKRSPEQNREESLTSDLFDSSVSSYSIDQDSQPAAPLAESSFTDEKDADNKEKRKEEWATDEILSLAGALFAKHDYLEAMEDVRELIRNGTDSKALYFSLWHTLNYYKPKGSISPRMYFRQELNERLGSLNAVAEAG